MESLGSGGLLPDQLLLARQHGFAELRELVLVEDLPRPLEHLALFLLDVVFEVLLHDLELGAPFLVVVGDPFDLGHDGVHDVVLLVASRAISLVLECSFKAG